MRDLAKRAFEALIGTAISRLYDDAGRLRGWSCYICRGTGGWPMTVRHKEGCVISDLSAYLATFSGDEAGAVSIHEY